MSDLLILNEENLWIRENCIHPNGTIMFVTRTSYEDKNSIRIRENLLEKGIIQRVHAHSLHKWHVPNGIRK